MTKRDALSISLKILGVVCLYKGVIYVISAGYSMATGLGAMKDQVNLYWYSASAILGPILLLAMAYILLRWADAISRKLVREDAEFPLPASNLWEKPVFVLALKVVGVVCLTIGVPDVVRGIGYFVALRPPGFFLARYVAREAVGGVFLLALGLYLISGGKHLVAFAFKERGSGPIPSQEGEP